MASRNMNSSNNNNNNPNTNASSSSNPNNNSMNTNKKMARSHEMEAKEKAKDTREACDAAVSSASSGLMHFVSSIVHAAMYQWQHLMGFLAPYIDALMAFPKKFFSQESFKNVYNDLYERFSNYTFAQFINDMVNITLTIMLLPLTLTVVICRMMWSKLEAWYDMWFGPDMTLNDLVNWIFASLKSGKNWAVGSARDLASGDLTWTQFWNNSLDNVESMVQRGMTQTGENSYFTWGVKKAQVIPMLHRWHADPVSVPVPKKND
jgi:hypothetical protein